MDSIHIKHIYNPFSCIPNSLTPTNPVSMNRMNSDCCSSLCVRTAPPCVHIRYWHYNSKYKYVRRWSVGGVSPLCVLPTSTGTYFKGCNPNPAKQVEAQWWTGHREPALHWEDNRRHKQPDVALNWMHVVFECAEEQWEVLGLICFFSFWSPQGRFMQVSCSTSSPNDATLSFK